MPADAFVLPMAVGECSRADAKSDHMEPGSRSQDPTARGQMAGHSPGRIDDTLLVREAQRGNMIAVGGVTKDIASDG